MPTNTENRLRAVAAMLAVMPLCSLWCIVAFEQMLDRQARHATLAAAVVGPGGSVELEQIRAVQSVVVPADDVYSLQVALVLMLILSILVGGVLASTIRRLPAGRGQAAPPSRPSEASTRPDNFDAGPPSVRDLMTAMHTLGSEMRRQVGEVSHEMRTPLAIIAGSLSAVRRVLPRDHRRAERSVDLIGKSCEKLVSILDSHRDATSRLVDSFLGLHVSIDIGAFLQDFVAHAGIGSTVSLTHPPQPLVVRTQAEDLRELMRLFLITGLQRCEGATVRLSIVDRENWIEIVLSYSRPGEGRSAMSVLPAVEWALGECRGHLNMMGATLKTTVESDGQVLVHLLLPADGVS